MNTLLPILKKEFLGYFRSPVGYVILAVFHLLAVGLAFFSGYYRSNQASLDIFFSFVPWIFLFFIPATGMRLWAEENRSGSIELLMTLPISISSAVIAKFLAAWGFIGIALGLTFSLAITTGYLGDPDWGKIISGYFACLLIAGSFLSISSLCSAMTKNQVIAFVISVLICFFATVLGSQFLASLVNKLPTAIANVVSNFSYLIHFQTMTRGLIELAALSFFLTTTAAFLAINIIILKR
ncbi:ABC transporter permease subunit [Puniceicoccaceae bacterium K14]|nr:ABC transporter permease subunit [Puniceicoccaceae bacterium K14]